MPRFCRNFLFLFIAAWLWGGINIGFSAPLSFEGTVIPNKLTSSSNLTDNFNNSSIENNPSIDNTKPSLLIRVVNGEEVLIYLHPQGISLKGHRHVSLKEFQPGEKIVVMPVGGKKKSYVNETCQLDALAIQDAKTYHENSNKSTVYQQEAYVSESSSPPPVPAPLQTISPNPSATYINPLANVPPELRDKLLSLLPQGKPSNIGATDSGGPGTNPTSSSLNFGEEEGNITNIDTVKKSFVISIAGSTNLINIYIGDKTKIYRFSNNQFQFLTLDQLKLGNKVKVSGFRQRDASLDAMMIILLK